MGPYPIHGGSIPPPSIFVSPTDGTDTITDSNRPPAQGKFDGKALAGGDSPDGKETLLFG